LKTSSENIPSSGSTTFRSGATLYNALVLFVCALNPGLAFGADLNAADTAALIDRLKEHRAKFPSLTADFTEEKTTRLLQKPLVTSGNISFSAPNRFRREVKGTNPSTTVCDGKEMWIYYPNFREAEHYTLGRHTFFDDSLAALTAGLNFTNIAEFYRYEASREADGYRLLLHPRTSGLKRMIRELTVSISDDFLIAKTEATMPKGDTVVTIYRNQRSQPVPASTFDFKPPSDANVSTPLGK
jgi:chaperone LolA